MKKIMIEHFLGKSVCTELHEVRKTLNQSIDGVNEFLISQDQKPYPYLAVLINEIYAYVSFIPSDESAGLQAFSDDAEMNLDLEGITIFYTNTPSEEIEIYNDYVIPKKLAIQIVLEFAEKGNLPSCTEWDEL